MKRYATPLAAALLAVSIQSVSSQQPVSVAGDTRRTQSEADVIGLYEGPRGFIAVSALSGGGTTRLLLADAASDQLRMLFPAAADSFAAGPEIARPAPIEFTLRVRRSASRIVDAIVLHRTDGGPDEIARRVALRAVPVAFTRDGATVLKQVALDRVVSVRGESVSSSWRALC